MSSFTTATTSATKGHNNNNNDTTNNDDDDYHSLRFLQEQSNSLLGIGIVDVSITTDDPTPSSPPSFKVCLAIAGGGGHALSTIASTPGASQLLLEGSIVYDRYSFLSYISEEDRAALVANTSFSYSSRQAAKMLSQASLLKAMQLRSRQDNKDTTTNHPHTTDTLRAIMQCVGMGASSTLSATTTPTKNPKGRTKSRGAIISSHANGKIQVATEFMIQSTNNKNRFEQDVLCSNFIVQSLREMNRTVVAAAAAAHDKLPPKQEIELLSQQGAQEMRENKGEQQPQDYATQTVYYNTDAHKINIKSVGGDNDENNKNNKDAASSLSLVNDAVVLIANNETKSFDELAYPVIPTHSLIFPGSFNPPHKGHIQLAKAALRQCNNKKTNTTLLFELSIDNADKPAMNQTQVSARVSKFWEAIKEEEKEANENNNNNNNDNDNDNDTVSLSSWGIIITKAPLFVDKVRLLRKYNHSENQWKFVIGTDTMVRILNPKYYPPHHNTHSVLAALRDEMQIHFIVGGRLEQTKTKPNTHTNTTPPTTQNKKEETDTVPAAAVAPPKFVTGQQELQQLPVDIQHYFTLLEEHDFRVDISSSELRGKKRKIHKT